MVTFKENSNNTRYLSVSRLRGAIRGRGAGRERKESSGMGQSAARRKFDETDRF